MRHPFPATLVALLLVAVLAPGASAQSPEASAPPRVAAPSPSASPAPIPTWPDAAVPGDGGTTPGVLDWLAADIPGLVAGREYADLTAWAGGFAVVERRDDEAHSRSLSPAVWTSTDGLAWTRHALPATVRTHGVLALLPLHRGLVVVSDVTTDYNRYGFDHGFWRSPDGADWTRAGTLSWRVPRAQPGCQATHRDYVSVGDALMLYVGVCWDPCCGFAPNPDSHVWAMQAANPVRGDTIAWRSTDAATWDRVRLRGVVAVSASDHASGFVTWPGEVYTLWTARYDEPVRLLRSNDGVAWSPVVTIPGSIQVDGIEALVPAGSDVLLAGTSFAIEGDRSAGGDNLLTWVAADGALSPPTMQRQPADATGAIRSGGTILLLGASDGPGPDPGSETDDQSWGWIMGSADGGRTWDPALSWTGSDGSCIGPAVQRGATVVMVGCRRWELEGREGPPPPALWVSTLPAAP